MAPRRRPYTAAAAISSKNSAKIQRTPAVSNGVPERHTDAAADVDNLSFNALAKILEPEPQILTPRWRKNIDRNNKRIVFYQLDTETKPPRLTKSVSLHYRSIALPAHGASKAVLVPTVYVGEKQVTNAHIREVLGRSYIHFTEDVAALLENIDAATPFNVDTEAVLRNDIIRTSVNSNSRASSRTKSGRLVKPVGNFTASEESSEEEDLPTPSDTSIRSRPPAISRPVSRPSVITPVPPMKPATAGIKKPIRKRRRPSLTYRPKQRARPKTSGDLPVRIFVSPATKQYQPSTFYSPLNTSTVGESSTHENGMDVDATTSSSDAINGNGYLNPPALPVSLDASEETSTAGTMLHRVYLYRQLAAQVMGKNIDDDLDKPSLQQAQDIKKAFQEHTGVTDKVWKSGVGAGSRFGLSSTPIWEQFKQMYTVFKTSQNLVDSIRMSYIRDYLVKVPEAEAIEVMRRCAEQMSVDPLRLAFKVKTAPNPANVRARVSGKAASVVSGGSSVANGGNMNGSAYMMDADEGEEEPLPDGPGPSMRWNGMATV